MISLRNARGQTTLEYAIVTGVVVAAGLALSIYFKNAAQGRGQQLATQLGEQYNPHEHTANFTTTFNTKRHEVLTTKGVETSTIQGTEIQDRKGSEDLTTTKLSTQKLFP